MPAGFNQKGCYKYWEKDKEVMGLEIFMGWGPESTGERDNVGLEIEQCTWEDQTLRVTEQSKLVNTA